MSNSTQQSQPPQAAVDQIIGLYNQGQLEQTVSLAESLAKQYSKALILYDILGAAYIGLGNADKTIASCQKALQLNPNHTDAYNNMGMALYDQGRFDEAVESYQKAIKLEPDFADAHYNLGNALKETGDLKQAIESYRASLAINSDDAEVLSNCGNALKDYGEFDQAVECYSKALKLDPNLTCVQANMDNAIEEKAEINKIISLKALQDYQKFIPEPSLGVPSTSEPPKHQIQELIQYYDLGKFEVVLSKAEPIVALFPEATVILNIMGSSNAGLENYDVALAIFEKALKINPNDFDVLNNMGIAQKDKGDLNAAVATFKQALKFKPDDAAVCFNMGIALREKGDLEAAIASYKMAIQIKPDFANAYNNMGIALQDKGDLDAAIRSLRQALEITPDFAESYLNMGNVLYEKGDLEAAIENYKHAIKIMPNYAEAYYNMGTALKDKGNLDAAIDSYKQAIKIKPDHAEAYNNMGNVLSEKGKLDAAIDSYKQALKTKPDYADAYNNVAFSLRATKLQNWPLDDRLRSLTEGLTSNYAEIAKAVLKYKLDLGSVSATNSLNNVVSLLSMADNICIDNPNFKNSESVPKPLVTEKITALVHFGRSGTGLLHSLIDGHPEVSTLPSIYLSEFFDHSAWKKIIAGGWEKMADRFISTYEVLFDASSATPIATLSGKSIKNLGQKEGMANLGEQRNEVLSVDKQVFSEELNRLMAYHDRLDAFTFLKLVHSAFDKALKDHNNKNFIFYHIHNPDTYAQLNFLKSAPDTNWLMMVREPLQSCESWVQESFSKNDYQGVVNRIFQMLFEIDNIIYQNENSIGLRLEDLKQRPKKTIPALCAWLGIKEEDSLYEMTAQGKKWWGDPASPDFAKDGMNPFGKTSISRKIGSVFSDNDQFILRTLFYPFSVRFGYAEENTEQFKIDLQAIRPMLDQMFGFEKKIVMETKAHTEQFMKSGSYLYLRSGMIERWNTLNEFHTYPNMLRPLKIN